MNGVSDGFAPAILLVGALAVAAAVARDWLAGRGVPALVGYLAIGFALSTLDHAFGLLNEQAHGAIGLLSRAGIVVLLFRVGLESHPDKLLRQLPNAGLALVVSVVVSAALGFVAARYVLGFALVPSCFAALALTATSVGVSLDTWREAGALDGDAGALLLDLAELDDVLAIFFMALLVAAAPILVAGDGGLLPALAGVSAAMLLKLAALVAGCIVFARYVERPVTDWFERLEATPAPIIPIIGIGFVIAAIAGWLGISVAVGALFAGLAFSRDPRRVQIDTSFSVLFQFFSPFFFIAIGLQIDVTTLWPALGVGAVLVVAGALGKVVGVGLPLLASQDRAMALTVGVSMVPRAEIAMVIMELGRHLGDGSVPAALFGGMALMSLVTCLVAPPIVRRLLRTVPV